MQGTQYWIDKLDLTDHPEGGCYQEVYRSPETLSVLPDRFEGPRNVMTSIYFMLRAGEFSSLHRIKSDELWVHVDGEDLEVLGWDSDGRPFHHLLGKSEEASAQVLVPAMSWFGSRPLGTYTLSACVVAPGFDFADFELGGKADLLDSYPAHRELIVDLTR
jgi:predicted cupin superfamily sugar epimerase